MAVICPTITADNPHTYREQMERIAPFAERMHLDFSDGKFTPAKLIGPIQAWWPADKEIDLHLMYQNPLSELETCISLQPNLIIVHAESEGALDFLSQLSALGIRRGVALLGDTGVDDAAKLLELAEYALVFSGNLGHFGGVVDFQHLEKVEQLKQRWPHIEVGWDGGVNDQNAKQLIDGGVDVLNTGGFIQRAESPESAYATLEKIVQETNL